MKKPQITYAYLLSSVICIGQYALAQTQHEEDANRCSDAIIERLGKHFRLNNFAYPESGMYPSVEQGGICLFIHI